jgi:uncharacterized membrane protein SirB2
MMILLQVCLVVHLAGLALMAGTTVSELIVFRAFSKRLGKDGVASSSLLDLAAGFPMMLGIGAGALILSGIGLMAVTHGAFTHQLWFQVKMLLIVAIILNGFITGGKHERRLKEGIRTNTPDMIKSAATNLQHFSMTQMALFLVIIILAVFKFN